ncbi:MAG: MarR family transcriptional regulator [Anaerolineales bacterium]|jgi:DNA-binding MarR family transcriptional regulator
MHPDPFVSTLQEWIEVSMRSSMRNFIRYARKSGFSMSHFGAMFHIHRMGSCGVTDLGDHLGVTSAAASQMLERLVQQELILREEDPNDRRVKRIILTDKGNKILEEGIRARQGWLNDLAHSLSDGEKETIMASLNILIDKVNQLTQPLEVER